MFEMSPGNLGTVYIDAGCVNSPRSRNGCSNDALVFDTFRGTVMKKSAAH